MKWDQGCGSDSTCATQEAFAVQCRTSSRRGSCIEPTPSEVPCCEERAWRVSVRAACSCWAVCCLPLDVRIFRGGPRRGRMDITAAVTMTIAATTAEINKRAVRLSSNLALPEIDDKARKQKPDDTPNDTSLTGGLLALDRSIMSFIANPIFSQPKVIDSENALKARSDLNLIIRLSEQLKTRHSY